VDVITRSKSQAAPETKPDTRAESAVMRDVKLMCEGPCHSITMHTFVVTRRAGASSSFEQIYGCMTCDTERRFGLL
jgi:hypothetical protein